MGNPGLTFTVTDDHLRLLKRVYIGWEHCEYGAPAIDCKRPYGNSDVAQDICEILGWEFDEDDGPTREQEDAARAIHKEMQVVLQILCAHLAIQPGIYTRSAMWRVDWERS